MSEFGFEFEFVPNKNLQIWSHGKWLLDDIKWVNNSTPKLRRDQPNSLIVHLSIASQCPMCRRRLDLSESIQFLMLIVDNITSASQDVKSTSFLSCISSMNYIFGVFCHDYPGFTSAHASHWKITYSVRVLNQFREPLNLDLLRMYLIWTNLS